MPSFLPWGNKSSVWLLEEKGTPLGSNHRSENSLPAAEMSRCSPRRRWCCGRSQWGQLRAQQLHESAHARLLGNCWHAKWLSQTEGAHTYPAKTKTRSMQIDKQEPLSPHSSYFPRLNPKQTQSRDADAQKAVVTTIILKSGNKQFLSVLWCGEHALKSHEPVSF